MPQDPVTIDITPFLWFVLGYYIFSVLWFHVIWPCYEIYKKDETNSYKDFISEFENIGNSKCEIILFGLVSPPFFLIIGIISIISVVNKLVFKLAYRFLILFPYNTLKLNKLSPYDIILKLKNKRISKQQELQEIEEEEAFFREIAKKELDLYSGQDE